MKYYETMAFILSNAWLIVSTFTHNPLDVGIGLVWLAIAIAFMWKAASDSTKAIKAMQEATEALEKGNGKELEKAIDDIMRKYD